MKENNPLILFSVCFLLINFWRYLNIFNLGAIIEQIHHDLYSVCILKLVSITLYRLCYITEAMLLMNLFQLMHLFSVQNKDISKIALKSVHLVVKPALLGLTRTNYEA
jgi:hypothetical protein